MSIIACPRCGGSGAILEGNENTTAGIQKQICPSCSGRGYVTDQQIVYPQTNGATKVNINWITPLIRRDPDRIDSILASLRAIWRRFPDWRLGQLLVNDVPDLERNIFYREDTITEKRMEDFEHKMDETFDKYMKALENN